MIQGERPVRRRRAGRVIAVLAGLTAAAGALVGCGPQHGEAEAGPTGGTAATGPATSAAAVEPPPSSSPAPSVVYSTPPEALIKPRRPDILDGPPSEAAAVAFAKYYLQMYIYAYLTGDGKPLYVLGQPNCVYCNNVKGNIAREYDADHHDEGGTITIEHASVHDYGVNGAFKVVLYGTQAPGREVDAQGRTVVEYREPERVEWDFGLVWNEEQGWLVAQMDAERR
jgi:hypothetical protein